MIAKFFIERPVLANVLAILFVLLGGVSLFALPVAQLPDVVPPTVQVTTRYPGANATDVMNTVGLPIEQQVNGVQGMLYMQSTSASDGTYSLIVTFAIGTDLNFAQVLVQNRVASAMASLPQAVQAQGVNVQQRSTAILGIVTLTSPDGKYDGLYLSNYAAINLQQEMARLPGVGTVVVFGAGQYAMRVWLDPDLMQARGLTVNDVTTALQQQSAQVTAGQIGAPPAQGAGFPVHLERCRPADRGAGEFENIIVKTGPDGAVTRIRDIGRVELGAQSYSQAFTSNGKPAAGMAIYQSPGANALTVAKEVRAKMAELARGFPQGMRYEIPFDTTKFVSASIDEVYKTLIEAGVLVLIVILVFLQDIWATLVPATTVPVTIIGAFAAMAALGFTVNLSTLFAIVLAIGIVVDDAIVVVEGAAHHIDAGSQRPRRRHQGHERAVRSDHRDHAGADVGVHPGRVPAWPDRPALRSVRPGDRRDRPDQRDQRRDLEADAMCAVAAADRADGEAQLVLSRLQPGLWRTGAVVCPPGRGDDTTCRGNGRPGTARDGGRHLWSGAVADRVPAAGRPGLLPDLGAIARCRIAQPHPGCHGEAAEDGQRGAGRAGRDLHFGHLGARQQRVAVQCGRRVRRPEGLERAEVRQRGPAGNVQGTERGGRADRGGIAARRAAAPDPGDRQFRRVHDAGGIARRQRGFCEIAVPDT